MSVREYKGYKVEALGSFPMTVIKARGQGKVPKQLTGLFTTGEEANRAIDRYLAGLVKGKRNGSSKGSSTG